MISSQISYEAKKLVQFLLTKPEGQLVTYAALSKECSADVRGSAYSALARARKVLIRDHQIRFETIRGIGLRKMSDREVAQSGPQEVRGVHRRALAGVKRMKAIREFDLLPGDVKTSALACGAALATIAHVTKPRSLALLEAATHGKGQTLSLSETIDVQRSTIEKIKTK